MGSFLITIVNSYEISNNGIFLRHLSDIYIYGLSKLPYLNFISISQYFQQHTHTLPNVIIDPR
ncbi:hypothetical protein RNJ44_03980 [Nakaseomyces bracarensis]|uniref:Uncharacterized protein n=1 Tax=Nakaseomyces bracarensis TaxID=273131 RepID=A0ABR4NTK7_9SACH